MTTKVPRFVGAVAASLVVAEVLLVWHSLSEACDDGLRKVHPAQYVPLGELLLAIAPFGLFPYVPPVLIGFLYWRLTRNSILGIPDLIFPVSLAALGLIVLAVCLEYTKQYAYLNGAKSGSLAAWLFNGSFNAGSLWLVLRSWNRKETEQDGTSNGG